MRRTAGLLFQGCSRLPVPASPASLLPIQEQFLADAARWAAVPAQWTRPLVSTACVQAQQAPAPQSPPVQEPVSGTNTSNSTASSSAAPGSSDPSTSSNTTNTSSSSDSSSGSSTSNTGAGSSTSSSGSGYTAYQAEFSNFRARLGGINTTSLLQDVSKEVQGVFGAGEKIRSATRKYTGPVADPSTFSGEAALVLVQQQQTAWQRLQEQVMSLPFLSALRNVRMEDTAAYKKGQELVADLKEKYENSDHPMVHKVEEVKERLLSGSESGRAMQEIRARDPTFDMNSFVRSIKLDAPLVTQAFLKHDVGTLGLHCGPELLERFRGIFTHFTTQGMFEDPTILFVGDVEIVEVRQMEDDPFIIAQFHCQQLKCTRDKFGNVIDGSANSIQKVFYFWGLQQEKVGTVTAEGELLPPRWVIKDMMWQSILALVQHNEGPHGGPPAAIQPGALRGDAAWFAAASSMCRSPIQHAPSKRFT